MHGRHEATARMSEERIVWVYCLRHPASGQVGYVGSAYNPRQRAREHFAERLWGSSQKAEWLRSVWRDGKRPEVVLLEPATENTRIEREQWWLDYYRGQGHPVTNRPGAVRSHR